MLCLSTIACLPVNIREYAAWWNAGLACTACPEPHRERRCRPVCTTQQPLERCVPCCYCTCSPSQGTHGRSEHRARRSLVSVRAAEVQQRGSKQTYFCVLCAGSALPWQAAGLQRPGLRCCSGSRVWGRWHGGGVGGPSALRSRGGLSFGILEISATAHHPRNYSGVLCGHCARTYRVPSGVLLPTRRTSGLRA